jgi:hypothetical protein
VTELRTDLPIKMFGFYKAKREAFNLVGNERTFSLLIGSCADFGYQAVAMNIVQEMARDEISITFSQALKILNIGLARHFQPLVKIGYDFVKESGG